MSAVVAAHPVTSREPLRVLRRLAGVRRAWPGREGSLAVELVDADGRLRAGAIDADGTLTVVPHATDDRLPGLRPGLRGRLVVHRLRRRAVVVDAERVIKLLRAGRAAGVAARMAAVSPAVRAAGLEAPRILARDAARLDMGRLPGVSLHDLADHALPGWRRLADAWPDLAARPVDLPTHTPADEADVLLGWLSHARRHGALARLAEVEAMAARTCRELVAGRAPAVLAHRDLHDKQVLWDGASLGLLDLDTAVRAEAALDLGNLVAHVELRHVQGRLSAATRTRLLTLLDDLAGRLPTDERRVGVHVRAARLRLACVYAFRPSAAAWLPAWIDTCEQNPLSDPRLGLE